MGFGPPNTVAQADSLIRAALDLGINFLDTANCYDGPERGSVVKGHAEQMLGDVLSEGLRNEFVLLSKVGVPLREGHQHRGLSTTHLLRELENSLRRLKTEFLDVYMLHWPDPFSDTDEVLRAVDAAVCGGKIRYFGISNHFGWQVCEYLWKADRRGWPMVGVSEIPINLLDRRFDNDLPFYEQHHVGVLAYQALKGGVISDRRLKAANQAEDSKSITGWNQRPSVTEEEVIARLFGLAEPIGLSLAELAIAWVASQPAVASVVLGARSAEQLQSGLRAAEVQLDSALLAAAETCAEVRTVGTNPSLICCAK
jgi:aryl-alcohol dehydrogenase-like predicted oxidoreductase